MTCRARRKRVARAGDARDLVAVDDDDAVRDDAPGAVDDGCRIGAL